MELNEKELENVHAGNNQGMSEKKALENPNLFRKSQINNLALEQNIYDTPQMDYETLNFLRNNTRLGPVATMKVAKARNQEEAWKREYLKFEPNDQIGVDYTQADELEFQLRMSAWEHSCEKMWKLYGDGLSLSEFAMDTLKQNLQMNGPRR